MSIIQIFTSHFHFIKLPFPLKHYVKSGTLLYQHAYLSPMNLNTAYRVNFTNEIFKSSIFFFKEMKNLIWYILVIFLIVYSLFQIMFI